MTNLYFSPGCHTAFLKALLILTRDLKADPGPPWTDRRKFSSVRQKKTLGNFQGKKTKGKAGWIFLRFLSSGSSLRGLKSLLKHNFLFTCLWMEEKKTKKMVYR